METCGVKTLTVETRKISSTEVSPQYKISLKFNVQMLQISNLFLFIDKVSDISETGLGKEQEIIWKAKVKSLLKTLLL